MSNSITMPNELKIMRKTGSLVVKLNTAANQEISHGNLHDKKMEKEQQRPVEKKSYVKREENKVTNKNDDKYRQKDDNDKYKQKNNASYIRRRSKSHSKSYRKSYSRSRSKSERNHKSRSKSNSRSYQKRNRRMDNNRSRSRSRSKQKNYSKDYDKKNIRNTDNNYHTHNNKEDQNRHHHSISHSRDKDRKKTKSRSRSRSRSTHHYPQLNSYQNEKSHQRSPKNKEEHPSRKSSYHQSYSKEKSYHNNSTKTHQINDFIPPHHHNNNLNTTNTNNKRGNYNYSNYPKNQYNNHNQSHQYHQQPYDHNNNTYENNNNTQYQGALQYQSMLVNQFNPAMAQLYQQHKFQGGQMPIINPIPIPFEKKEKEPSNTVLVSNLGPDITKEILEDIFREKCLELQTSMPEDIHFIEGLHCAYIIFPSIPVCMYIVDALQGYIYINGNHYEMIYTPNIQQPTNKESVTYITHLSDSSAYTTSMETTVHEDWFCEYCDCKNFSRRLQCYKCKRNKTINCRIAPVIKQKTTVMGEGGEIPPSSSLMIRGAILKESDDAELLEAFSVYGQVKDIRMAKDKLSNQLRDYAFIEYFSIEDATHALGEMKKCPMKIRGCQIFATYSKIKREENIQPQVFSSYAINTTNLTAEEQEKLNKINHLQSLCQNSKNNPEEYEQVIKKNNNTTLKDKNIRREMTQKEKVENEMKKWAKKMEKNKSNDNANVVPVNNDVVEKKTLDNVKPSIPQTQMEINEENDDEEQYDTVITFGVKTKEDNVQKEEINTNKENPSPIPDTSVICLICQRKFPSQEKLQMHEAMSELHKKNVEKLSQKTPTI